VGPLTATSLNRSGEPAARTRAEALAVCRVGREPRPAVLAGSEDAGQAAASTVVDVSEHPPRVLRWGAIGAERLESALAEIAA
jgi:tRNA A37 threonylcarbamoyladenosine synthetase subunit TsaC/SUA5/YrdC